MFGFFCTSKWISYMCTYIFSFLDFLPIQVATEPWVEFPVISSRFSHWLSILYVLSVACVRQSQSPNSSYPFLPPSVHTSVLYVYFCFANKTIYTIFLDSMYMLIHWYLFFSFWLTSSIWLSRGPSMSLQRTPFHAFLWLSNISPWI